MNTIKATLCDRDGNIIARECSERLYRASIEETEGRSYTGIVCGHLVDGVWDLCGEHEMAAFGGQPVYVEV